MIDASLATFERDVIDASREAPVLVDFWAPWCGPCRALGPLLEKLEREDAGRWRLVKINSDENPELSQRFGVRSIPFVVAFADGKAISHFVGAQPEGAIRRFLADLVPAPAEVALREARDARARGDDDAATGALRQALALDPSFDAARIDLVQLLLDHGDSAGAREHWSLLSGRAAEAAGHAVAGARLEAAEKAASLPAASLLEARIAADPADLAARLDLAEVHIASRAFAQALDQLLEIVKRDRAFGDDIGRRKMLAVFEMAEPDLVSDYRRRLAGALY